MKQFSKKKLAAGIAAGAVTLAGAGVAYAYFTTSGSGQGTATVGHDTALVLHGVAGTALYPGTTSPVSFTVDNASPGHEQLGTIYLSAVKACPAATPTWDAANSVCTDGATPTPTTNPAVVGCGSVDAGNVADAGTSDFYMADVLSNQDFGNGDGQTVTAGGTLKMNNLNASQNACKDAALNLLLSTR